MFLDIAFDEDMQYLLYYIVISNTNDIMREKLPAFMSEYKLVTPHNSIILQMQCLQEQVKYELRS